MNVITEDHYGIFVIACHLMEEGLALLLKQRCID
jgi:hypothetical protein